MTTLPAFVPGCVIARPDGQDTHCDNIREGHQEELESPEEQKVSTIISVAFMVLVVLSMPPIVVGTGTWQTTVLHVIAIMVLANIGRTFSPLRLR